jgi:hypothetical protein
MFSAPVSVEPSRGCDNGRTVQVGPGTQVTGYPTQPGIWNYFRVALALLTVVASLARA